MLNKNKDNKSKDNKSIVTIDPYLQTSFKFSKNEVDVLDVSKNLSHKNQNYVSYLKLKNLSTTTIEVPKSIDNEDISNIVSIKAYEELSLDASMDYKIAYIEMSGLNSENRFFNVFAIDTQTIQSIFQTTANNVRYIDYIALAPLLYGYMYKKNLLPKTNVDCFINFSKDDAFLTVYQGGEYFTSRPLRYNLTYIKDKFCEQAGERMGDQAFFHMFKQNGILADSEDNMFSKLLEYVMEDCISYVGDVINSLNRIYEITINNVFIDTEIGTVNGLCEFVSKKLDIPASEVNANMTLNAKNLFISQNHNLMNIAGWTYLEEQNDDFNFSVFKRPDPFVKRKSGKFILALAGAFLLSIAYPAFNYVYGMFLQNSANKMQEEYDLAHAEENRIKNALASIADSQKRTREELAEEGQRLEFRKNLLREIDDKKHNYKMRSVIIYELSTLLNKNEVKVNQIVGSDKNLTIRVQSNSDKKITELIKSVSNLPNYSISTREISFRESPVKFYESNISVEIR